MLKATEVKEKVKGWLLKDECENLYSIIIGLTSAAACFAGYKYSEHTNAVGLSNLHNDGFVKFLNPKTGSEVTVAEACELTRKFYKK